MTNTATPENTISEKAKQEKAKQFFAIARELIDLCTEENRAVLVAAIKGMVDMANECDAMKEREYAIEGDEEREKAWAEYYANYGKEGA